MKIQEIEKTLSRQVEDYIQTTFEILKEKYDEKREKKKISTLVETILPTARRSLGTKVTMAGNNKNSNIHYNSPSPLQEFIHQYYN